MNILAGIILFVLTLLAFSVVYPLNRDSWDDWAFYYVASPQAALSVATYATRPFSFAGAFLANLLMPAQAQSIFIFHVLGIFITAYCVFCILNRLLPNYTWFAFLSAAIYLFYIPYNNSQLIPLHFQVYSWALMLGSVAFALYIEQHYLKGFKYVLCLIIASLFGIAAVLSYESIFPILATVPILLWLKHRKFSLQFLVSSSVWYFFLTVGFLIFLIPYLGQGESAWYQQGYPTTKTFDTFFSSTFVFYANSFPILNILDGAKNIIYEQSLTILVSLGCLAGLVVYIFLRLSRTEYTALPPRLIGKLFILALILNGIGGIGYIYSMFHQPRSQFFSAPAQAVVICTTFCMLASLLEKRLHISQTTTIAILTVLSLTLGIFWYFQHQNLLTQIPNFSDRLPLFSQLVSLIPHVEPHTLIIYECRSEENLIKTFAVPDVYAIRYLYNDQAGFIHITEIKIDHKNSALTFDRGYGDLLGPTLSHNYNYNEAIIVQCMEDGLTIATQAPEVWQDNKHLYNPYSRITQQFIDERQAQITAR